MFMAGANSIFTGDRLLTTSNPEFDSDKVGLNLLVSRLCLNVLDSFALRQFVLSCCMDTFSWVRFSLLPEQSGEWWPMCLCKCSACACYELALGRTANCTAH